MQAGLRIIHHRGHSAATPQPKVGGSEISDGIVLVVLVLASEEVGSLIEVLPERAPDPLWFYGLSRLGELRFLQFTNPVIGRPRRLGHSVLGTASKHPFHRGVQ